MTEETRPSVTTTQTEPGIAPTTEAPPGGPKPVLAGRRPRAEAALVYAFTLLPVLALAAAVVLAWGHGLSPLDVGLAIGFYLLSGFGVTVGFHRHFTHRSFAAPRPLRVALAIAGSTALQGDIITWVADHRRHHAFSDKEGDPHSPWRFGTGPAAMAKGFWHAHLGWLFDRDRTNAARFAPDLLADRDIVMVSRLFPLWTAVGLFAPALHRRAGHRVLVGRAERVPVGRSRARRRPAPRHLVDQLDLSHGGRTAFHHPRPRGQRLAAGDPVDGRVVAQPAPRRPDLRPPRCTEEGRSTCPPA